MVNDENLNQMGVIIPASNCVEFPVPSELGEVPYKAHILQSTVCTPDLWKYSDKMIKPSFLSYQ